MESGVMYSVLFVCTANLCRSPMAMVLLRARVSSEARDWRIESAGLRALEGYPAAACVFEALKEKALEVNSHRSRRITRDLMGEFNLVLVMEQNHKEALRVAFPGYARQIYLLSEMVDEVYDIIDPIGAEQDEVEETMKEIDSILALGLDRIRLLAGSAVSVHAST